MIKPRDPQLPEPFAFSPDDPLPAEYVAVATWSEEAARSLGESNYYQSVDPKSLTSGQRLLEANAEQARRYVMAAVAQVRYWDEKNITERLACKETRNQPAGEA
jgi:hypothetical protein